MAKGEKNCCSKGGGASGLRAQAYCRDPHWTPSDGLPRQDPSPAVGTLWEGKRDSVKRLSMMCQTHKCFRHRNFTTTVFSLSCKYLSKMYIILILRGGTIFRTSYFQSFWLLVCEQVLCFFPVSEFNIHIWMQIVKMEISSMAMASSSRPIQF